MILSSQVKVGAVVFCVVLLGAPALGLFSHGLVKRKLQTDLSQYTAQYVTLAAANLQTELESVARFSHALADLSLGSEGDQVLKKLLIQEPRLVSFALYRVGVPRYEEVDGKLKKSTHSWELSFRLIRPKGDELRMPRADFEWLNQAYPITFPKKGETSVGLAYLRDGRPLLRVVMPHSSSLLLVEILQEAMLKHSPLPLDAQSYVVDASNKVVMSLRQDNPNKDSQLGEDFSYLPLLSQGNGDVRNLIYQDLPGGQTRVGSYKKLAFGGLAVITQASLSSTQTYLTDYSKGHWLGSLFLALVLGTLGGWITHRMRLFPPEQEPQPENAPVRSGQEPEIPHSSPRKAA